MENNILKINLCKMVPDIYYNKCGYCKGTKSSKYGIYLDYIPIEIYEEMYMRGWTKSGTYFYKPSYEKTCCKLYQPRVNINEFKMSKEQKKVMKRFRKYLSGEYEENKLKNKENKIEKKEKIEDNYQLNITQKLKDYIDSKTYMEILKKYIKEENKETLQIILHKIKEAKVRRNTNKKYNSDYSFDFIFIIKNILISNSKTKQNTQIEKKLDIKNIEKELFCDFKNFYQSNNEDISFCEETGHINFKIKNQQEFKNFLISNKAIIKEKSSKKVQKENNPKEKYTLEYFSEFITEPQINLPLKHIYTFEITDKISVNEDDERFKLYKKYQILIHKNQIEEVTPERYNKNWGTSILQKDKIIPKPADLINKTKHPEIYPNYYGSYNFIHRIDGKIIAVTVVDILPTMFLSDYCYYDTEYSFLDLGVFTAIREIEYMKSFQKLIDNNFKYYSLEEFCQTCQKLKYKANYYPTEIMDLYTGKYVLLNEEIKNLIEDGKCHHLIEKVENPELEFFTDIEKENIYWNLYLEIKSLGEFQYLDDFCNLYLDIEKRKKIMINLMRFLEIIDKKSFDKCRFYYEEISLEI